ncbi:MAG: hypothetical protein R2711_06795 [Acidimicrobiales bacterium]
MGRPSSLWWSGSDTAGWPVMLNGAVKWAGLAERMTPAKGSSGVAPNWPRVGGSSGIVGVRSRS